jgi:glutaredoxin
MHEVIVYSRTGCHLCDVVKDTLTHLQSQADFHWQIIDIDTDPILHAKYNEEVPVVFINNRKAFKFHLDPQQFLRALAAK